MEIPLYIVDAFTNRAFGGNPAAVCPLDSWLDEGLMQAIAAENNLAETAFLVPAGDSFELRWFTPKVEVSLCGHATLASAFVLDTAFYNKNLKKNLKTPLKKDRKKSPEYRFQTQSGDLIVTRQEDFYYLNFPTRTLSQPDDEAMLMEAVTKCFKLRPECITMGDAVLIAEYANEQIIRSLVPDISKISALECKAVNITSRGDDCDFVSRFFAPNVGIDEDAVTGSAHCGLIPYWHRITGKTDMLARQISLRGGELRCRYAGERVEIGGQAVLFSQGKIRL